MGYSKIVDILQRPLASERFLGVLKQEKNGKEA